MSTWHITETEFDPQALHHKETVFTIGNGYLGTRGAFEEGYPDDWPATLVHGVFDDAPRVHTELANVPNWLPFVLFVNGERFRMDRGTPLSYRRDLDLRTGALTRTVRWRGPAGHTVHLAIERFASLAAPHILGIRYRVTALDFEGRIEFRAGLDGHVDNARLVHWRLVEQGNVEERGVYLHVRTRGSGIELCAACYLTVSGGEGVTYAYRDCECAPAVVAHVTLRPGEQVVADKLVALVTSREEDDVRGAARSKLEQAIAHGYDDLRAANETAWEREWEVCNVTIEGDDEADLALRYNLFQLLIAAPRHDDRVSIPAKTLSGFGYRGHVFWDTDIFVIPFFAYTRPRIARNLLLYRHHTLPGARRKAQANGYEGAMFAWESADTGDETTPRWGYASDGEPVRIWCGDIEHHISADVAYAMHQYWRVTGDDDFMRDYGTEIVLDTARFWGSRVEWNGARGRYEINDVIGPDEYHEHVDNNVFTNRMARWNLETALETLAWLRREFPEKAAELEAHLDLTPERLAHWAGVIGGLHIAHDPETGLMEQFDRFFDLADIDLADYESRRHSMQAELGIEGLQSYQVLKQPDVLMLLYLLEDRYDQETLRVNWDYYTPRNRYDQETLRVNWDYYTPRTDLTYGSSLGPAIHALLAARLGQPEAAHEFFVRTAWTDLKDTRGNTAHGIHAALAGGLWQAVIFGFAGLELNGEGYTVNPQLPAHWKRLSFSFFHRGEKIDLALSRHGSTENK
jgi:kojibiose phosphorylase